MPDIAVNPAGINYGSLFPPFVPVGGTVNLPDEQIESGGTIPTKQNFFSQFGSDIIAGITGLGQTAINNLTGGGSATSYNSGGGYDSSYTQTDNTKYWIIGGILVAAIGVAIYFAMRKKKKK